jgi:hypothetical protein
VGIDAGTGRNIWLRIANNSTRFKDLPLSYTNYYGEANYEDFEAFGGWKKPTKKEFHPPVTFCDVIFGKTWFPSNLNQFCEL